MKYIFYLLAFLILSCEETKQSSPDLQIRVANLEAQGKEQGLDFEVFIISQSEFESASKEDLNKWMLSRFEDKTGAFSELNYNGELGLVEGLYSTGEEDFEVLLLVVDKTSKSILPKSDIYYVTLDTTSTIDQTISLQEQINSIPDGTRGSPVTIVLPDGKYWTEGDLKNNPKGANGILAINDRHHLIIDGYGTTLYTKAPAVPFESSIDENEQSLRRHVWITHSSHIEVQGLRIEGSNTIRGNIIGSTPELTPAFWVGGKDKGSHSGGPAYHKPWELEHAFANDRSQYITYRDVEAYGIWGDGIYIGGKDHDPSRYTTIIGGHLEYTGRQGVAASNAEYILIDSLTTNLGRRAILDWEPYEDEGFVRYVEVKNSKLWGTGTLVAALGRGDVSYINIHHNEYRTLGNVIDCKPSGDWERRSNWKFNYNVSINEFGSPQPNIKFVDTDSIEIIGNTILIDPKQSQVTARFTGGTNIVVKENNFGHGKYIMVYDCENVIIEQPELEVIKL